MENVGGGVAFGDSSAELLPGGLCRQQLALEVVKRAGGRALVRNCYRAYGWCHWLTSSCSERNLRSNAQASPSRSGRQRSGRSLLRSRRIPAKSHCGEKFQTQEWCGVATPISITGFWLIATIAMSIAKPTCALSDSSVSVSISGSGDLPEGINNRQRTSVDGCRAIHGFVARQLI